MIPRVAARGLFLEAGSPVRVDLDDTIAALASSAGSAARGIIRLSGDDVVSIVERVFRSTDADMRTVRSPASLRSRASGAIPSTAMRYVGCVDVANFRAPIPVELYLWPNARSYTGQPAAELHLSGSPPLLEAVLAELYAQGARPARPGEFTLRAFLSGKIDLVQAEAVLGVIDAEDQPRLKTALAQLAGGISGRIEAVQSDLLNLLADLEAGLDFVEDDIEFVSRDDLLARIASARQVTSDLLERAALRMLSSGRRNVVIAGLPNAGKSTLFNALLGRDSALVSNVSGTTRDYLAAECDWQGTGINLIDTAGWEKSNDELSAEAQQQRARQIEQADLVLWCSAADLDDDERAEDDLLRRETSTTSTTLLHVVTKLDTIDEAVVEQFSDPAVSRSPDRDTGSTAGIPGEGRPAVVPGAGSGDPRTTGGNPRTTGGGLRLAGVIRIAAVTGAGLQRLMQAATAELSREATEGQELVGTTAARCRESLQSAHDTLDRAHAAVAGGAGEEVVAIDLHEALEHLGRIVGSVYTDDILDRLFSRFCIGK